MRHHPDLSHLAVSHNLPFKILDLIVELFVALEFWGFLREYYEKLMMLWLRYTYMKWSRVGL
jgi:hypothetical protein